jgi:hypothetical protein
VLHGGDTAIVYGRADALETLNRRRRRDPQAGDHDEAARRHAERLRHRSAAARTGQHADRHGRRVGSAAAAPGETAGLWPWRDAAGGTGLEGHARRHPRTSTTMAK